MLGAAMSTLSSSNLSMVSVSIASNQSDVSYVDREPDQMVHFTNAPPSSPADPRTDALGRFEKHVDYYFPQGDIKLLVST